MYIPSFIQLWKILLFSVLWSGFAKSPVCVLFCFFSFSPRQRKSNWLIQVCTIAPQIWEKLVLVLFSGPGDGRGGWKTKMAFLLPNGHPVKSLLDGPALSGEHTSSVKKIWKQNRTSPAYLSSAQVSGERRGCGMALCPWDLWLVVQEFVCLILRCCPTFGRTYFRV